MSNIWKLNSADFIKGLVVAVVSAVLTLIVEILKQKGFDLTGADYQQILQIALTAGMAYLAKNLATDTNGRVLGKF